MVLVDRTDEELPVMVSVKVAEVDVPIKSKLWQAKVDKNGVFSNITNSFSNITNSFSNITNSFIDITNSFSNITN